MQKLAAASSKTAIGDALDSATYGAMRIRSRSEGYIAKAVEQGAHIAYGGKRPEGVERGYFLSPPC